MQGLMMNRQLLISSLIEHGGTVYHDREIVSRPQRVRYIGTPTPIYGGAASSWPAPSPRSG